MQLEIDYLLGKNGGHMLSSWGGIGQLLWSGRQAGGQVGGWAGRQAGRQVAGN